MAMSINTDGLAVTERFFRVIDMLTDARHLRGLQTYTSKYGINRRNLQHVKESPDNTVLKPEVLTPLVRDFGVSGTWLLTGDGPVFRDGTDVPVPVKWKNRSRQPKADGSSDV